jgi:hypothetical protein
MVVAMPLAAVAALLSWIFGVKRNLSAHDVAEELRNFLTGQGDASAWDDFTTLAIRDPKLDHIRERAFEVDLPLSEDGAATLRKLLAEAEQLASESGKR